MVSKTLLIKLGTDCNLKCKHCHCKKMNFKYNPDIKDFINKFQPNNIAFSGGEPLLYLDIIKDIVGSIKYQTPKFRMVTNGFFLNEDNIEYFNKNNFRIGISYDGRSGTREGYPENFKYLKLINDLSMSTTVYRENIDFRELFKDMAILSDSYQTPRRVFPNFIHQTINSQNFDKVDSTIIKKYIVQVCEAFEVDVIFAIKDETRKIEYLSFLSKFVEMMRPKNFKFGVECCNENKLLMTLDGNFMLCSYDDNYIGNIYDGVDWSIVAKSIPTRCKECGLWNSCRNRCIANITENECIIYKNLNHHYNKILKKYNLTDDYFIKRLNNERGNSNE